MGAGDAHVTKTSRKSLRMLGSVGEPINPEAWEWYFNVVGNGKVPIVDTWWQTETGGILITPLPGATDAEGRFGDAAVLRRQAAAGRRRRQGAGRRCQTAISASPIRWPGQMRTVYGDHERFVQTYFSTYKGKYFTGDGCRRDEDGYYWITGRVDDVINVSGHRMGTAEVESALVSHDKVSEAAVVGYPHDIKGQGIYCYVTLMAGEKARTSCARNWSPMSARRSAPSPRPTRSSSRRACRKPAPARSCAASCARSPRTISARSAIPRRSPIRRSSTT